MSKKEENNSNEFLQEGDVGKMFDSFRQQDGAEEETKDTEHTSEEQEKEESAEEQVNEEQAVEEGEVETASEEEESEPDKEVSEKEEEAPKSSESDALRKTLEKVSGEVSEEPKETKAKEGVEEPEDKQKGEETEDKQASPFEISEDEFSEIMKDKQKFANFLNKFGDVIRQQAREETLRDIPSVVSKTTQRQQTLMQKKSKFYEDNPELKNHENYVGYVATKLYSQDPSLDVDNLFNKTAEQVKKDLALDEQAVKAEDSRLKSSAKKRKQPAFASSKAGGSRSNAADNRSELQSDLDAMIESTL